RPFITQLAIYSFAALVLISPVLIPTIRLAANSRFAVTTREAIAYSALAPSPLEGLEALEQLRALWHGHRIVVATTDEAPPAGVDTPADLERVRAAFARARAGRAN
ncbi:MAG TPA: hypothetical protein PKC20_10030, partial [Burkholderiaceae bacterium]|nr:hypothetical protein [Burkholderiaceae bacterium]